MRPETEGILRRFSEVKVLVIGDVMLDRYWWGSVSRISPEAPVPIVKLERESHVIGGAGNVAANIKGLGATPYLIGIVGDDYYGEILKAELEVISISSSYLVSVKGRPTTVKTRVIAHNQQVSRIDSETNSNLSKDAEGLAFAEIEKALNLVDIVVVSDYAKGFLSNNLLTRLIEEARKRNKKVLVDPKGKDFSKYRYASILTPNLKESIEASQLDSPAIDIAQISEKLLADLKIGSLLITRGEDGMTIFEPESEPIHLDAQARHVYDVTGAGDTVIATLAVALAADASLTEAAEIANIAAGLVVGEVGTSAITLDKLQAEGVW